MRHPGPARTPFELVEGDPASNDLFDGIDTTWASRFPKGGAAVGAALEEAIRTFEPAHPERTIPLLLKARPLIAAMADPRAKEKLAELDETVALCAGLWTDAQARQPEVIPGSPLTFTTTVLNRSTAQVTFEGGQVEGMFSAPLDAKQAKLGYNQSATAEFTRAVPAGQPYSQPYWLVKPPTGRRLYGGRPVVDRPAAESAGGPGAAAAFGGWNADRTGAARSLPVCGPGAGGARPPAPGGASGGRGAERLARALPDRRRAEGAGGGAGQRRKRLGRPAAGSAARLEGRAKVAELSDCDERRTAAAGLHGDAALRPEHRFAARHRHRGRPRDRIGNGADRVSAHSDARDLSARGFETGARGYPGDGAQDRLHHGRRRRHAGRAAATGFGRDAAQPVGPGAGRSLAIRCDRGRNPRLQRAAGCEGERAATDGVRAQRRYVHRAVSER